MTTHNTLTCLFGHHDYSGKLTRDKYGRPIHLCQVCKRYGYMKWPDGRQYWYNYDEEGNLVCERWDNGFKVWRDYDKKGNITHVKWGDKDELYYGEGGDGVKRWRHCGMWVRSKPENWKYEKHI